MNVIKRNGAEVEFDIDKIIHAIQGANRQVPEKKRMTEVQIRRIAESVTVACDDLGRSPAVEEIQDFVEQAIMQHGAYEVAKQYITYRYTRSLVRQSHTTDDKILSVIECNNEEAKQENSNKNPVINSTQRDYMAGEVSRDLTKRILLPEEITAAHEAGIIHFHDSDYYAQKEHNCDLINLEDMLQNGTVISETMIEKPHSFYTACNITTQIIAQVASNQYGGQSFSLAHLAPFVDISRKKLREHVIADRKACGESMDDEIIDKITERRLREEVKNGIQTIQYQLITLMTCNGQAPFVTMFMYLDEVPEGQTRDDLAMCIEEVLRQRLQGVKNEKGVWITPAFPKLIYVLDEDNITEASIMVAAQNCATEKAGAYTGEVSADMIASTGAKCVILGHSERRSYYGETSPILVKKVAQALDSKLEIIFCVGEVLEEREAEKHFEVVKQQLTDGLFNLTPEQFAHVVIAYEPVWAIGTGKTATPAQAQEMHAFIRSVVAEKYGQTVANETSILYGGSCNPGNADAIFSNPDVDGGLIGGASLKAADFFEIIKARAKH